MQGPYSGLFDISRASAKFSNINASRRKRYIGKEYMQKKQLKPKRRYTRCRPGADQKIISATKRKIPNAALLNSILFLTVGKATLPLAAGSAPCSERFWVLGLPNNLCNYSVNDGQAQEWQKGVFNRKGPRDFKKAGFTCDMAYKLNHRKIENNRDERCINDPDDQFQKQFYHHPALARPSGQINAKTIRKSLKHQYGTVLERIFNAGNTLT